MHQSTVSPLNFNIPIDFTDPNATGNIKAKWLGFLSDSYFCLSKKRAVCVQIDGLVQNTTLTYNTQTSKLLNVIKVITWLTGIIPLIMLVAKAIFRWKNNFQEFHKSTEFIANQLYQSIRSASKEEIIFEGHTARYLGSFSDGSESWNVSIERYEEDLAILRLFNTLYGKEIVLDKSLSQQLYDLIREKRKAIDP